MADKQIYIQRIKEIYKAKTGQQLNDTEAFEYFEKLIALVETIYKPIKLEPCLNSAK
jgi:hypothetical protein